MLFRSDFPVTVLVDGKRIQLKPEYETDDPREIEVLSKSYESEGQDTTDMTKAEIMDQLDALGIEYSVRSKKDDLAGLLAKHG